MLCSKSHNVLRPNRSSVVTHNDQKSKTTSKSGFAKIIVLYIRTLFIQLICNLEDYVNDTVQYTSRGRLGEILCLIPTLKSISNELIELIQFTKLFGFADVDALIQEMLLNRDDNDSMNVFQDITDTSRMTQESMAPQITEVNYMDSGRQGNKQLFNARVPQVKHLSDLGMVT